LLVGRSNHSHFSLPTDDPYFSRRHFLVEVNPPRCRLLDLKSRNGIWVNGQRVESAELRDGDEIKAGHTIFRLSIAGVPAAEEAPSDPRATWQSPTGGPARPTELKKPESQPTRTLAWTSPDPKARSVAMK